MLSTAQLVALCCDNSIVLLSLQRVISVALTDGELNELVTHHALDKAHQLAELAAGIPHRMHAGEFGLQHLLSLTDQPERANKVSVRQKPTDALLRCHTNSDWLNADLTQSNQHSRVCHLLGGINPPTDRDERVN